MTLPGLGLAQFTHAATVEMIARICHEANRALCIAIGDVSQVGWDEAPDWQKASAREGVTKAMAGEGPEQLHVSWCDAKVRDGWIYGDVKDPEAKTHPCLVPYADLPPDQRYKDHLFSAIVRVMTKPIDTSADTLTDEPFTAAAVIERAMHSLGCLGRSAADEPVFVLCARDVLAGDIVREWADRVEVRAVGSSGLTGKRRQKIATARREAVAMDTWRQKNGGTLPGADEPSQSER